MPPVSAPAAGSTPATKDRNARQIARNKQHVEDQIIQFRIFLDNHTKGGSPLPVRYKKLSLRTLVLAAGLPLSCVRLKVLRTIAEEYAPRVGVIGATEFRARFPSHTSEALPPVHGLTYQQLFDLDAAALGLKNANGLSSYRSALDRFMESQGKTVADQIGAEMAGGYEQALEQFIQKHYSGENQNPRPAKSYLNKYQQMVAKQQREDGLPVSLSEALTQLVEQDGRSAGELSEASGQRQNFVSSLRTGRQRSAPTEALTRLEEVLGVGAGTLTLRATHHNPRYKADFCPQSLFPVELRGQTASLLEKRNLVRKLLPDNFPSLPVETQQQLVTDTLDDIKKGLHLSENGRRISEAKKNPYTLSKDEMPQQLKKEFDELCLMKRTRGTMARGKKNKDRIWNPRTEDLWSETMLKFFGWCLLPADALNPMMRGAGLSLNDLTLGLILIPTLIEGYVEFRRTRAEGKDTRTSKMFLVDSIAMLRAGHGWIEGTPTLLQHMPAEFQQVSTDWQAQCAQQHSFLIEVRDDLDFEVSRDSFEPIQAIINMGRPMDVVQEALANNWDELRSALQNSQLTARQKAEMFRDHVLISMIAALPLRASHWFKMTYRTNARDLTSRDDGELRYVGGKHLGLYLRAKDFKNRRNKSIFGPNADRDVVLLFHEAENALRDLEPLVDEYMRVHRPQLCAGNGPVFPNVSGTTLNNADLRGIVYYWSERYLSEHGDHRFGLRIQGVRPFGPHAFRHLMATHILKTTGKYEDAANMLLDSITMIMSHYARFMPEDRLLLTFQRLDITRAVRKAI